MRPDLIYVDKNDDSNLTNDWKYYRVTPIAQMNIEVCEIEFPSLRDKSVPTQTPGIVGLAAAHDINVELLQKSYGIVHERAVLIGVRWNEQL
jgi:hypothetical protein